MLEGLVCSRIAAPWPQRVDVLRRCDTSACLTASVRHARPGYAERTTGRRRGVFSCFSCRAGHKVEMISSGRFRLAHCMFCTRSIGNGPMNIMLDVIDVLNLFSMLLR